MKKIILFLMIVCFETSIVLADCPTDVYDYDSGNYLYNTDARSKCERAVEEAVNQAVEEACYAGYRKCRNECDNDKCEDACRYGKRACENSK